MVQSEGVGGWAGGALMTNSIFSVEEESELSTGESEGGKEELGLRREDRAELPFGRVGCWTACGNRARLPEVLRTH